MSSRIRTLTFALALAPFAFACSAGGGDPDSEITGPGASGAPAGTTPGLVSSGSPSLAPPDGQTGGPNLGAMTAGEDEECDSILDVIYRDFNETHPDFEMASFSGDVVRLQLLQPNLGPDKKPVFRSSLGCPMNPQARATCANWVPDKPTITSAATFDQWFRTTSGVNMEFPRTLELIDDGTSHFVFDSSAFFPLAPMEGFGATPANPNANPGRQNFLFTTEIHVTFTYTGQQQFTFRGDDDLWIYVNNKLALDLGSMHGPEAGTIDFDAMASALGISIGGVYPMDIFQAERHTSGSNFRFETNITCFAPVIVR